MQVVYVFDKNYIELYKISSRSLLKHNPEAKITVVSPEPLGLENNIVITPPELKQRENDRITKTTYLKLLLTQLPYDKILLIDADTIIQGSLKELWNKDVYLGMTQSHTAGLEQAKEHGHDKYFLSGVMLMNLKALREDNFTEKCLEPFNFDGQWQHEETIINKLFFDKITELDYKYNYCHNRHYPHRLHRCYKSFYSLCIS